MAVETERQLEGGRNEETINEGRGEKGGEIALNITKVLKAAIKAKMAVMKATSKPKKEERRKKATKDEKWRKN